MGNEQVGDPMSNAPAPARDIAAEVLAISAALAAELHPHLRRPGAVTLDSNLDNDLGLDSLGRAELVLRLDRAFKVRLPETLIGEVATPRDLVRAVADAAPALRPAAHEVKEGLHTLPGAQAPTQYATLLDALAWHVAHHPARPHILSWVSETEETVITYSDLDREARAIARGLIERGLEPGDRVGIMLPSEPAFFYSFFGALMAGGVPVPVYPPFRRSQIEEHVRRQAGILRNAGTRVMITNEEIRPLGALLKGLVPDLKHVEVPAELTRFGGVAAPFPATPETMALIQYTSGSTGDPKGVVLSHGNLTANIRSMIEGSEATSSDVFISWLPLYHDMGLIGAWLACLVAAVPTLIMSPLTFLSDPSRWLKAISRHGGSMSAAPNFAYELCVRSIREEDIKGIDLSSMRMSLNGAEPVSASTIERFTDRFKAYGFKPGALAPVYGLAECSVGLAFPPLNRVPPVDVIKRDTLARRGVAEPTSKDDPTAVHFVACGHPLPRHQIRIVDDAGHELPERREGRLQFSGPSTTQGYFRNPEKTKALVLPDGWLDSGDRAYVANGDIYLTGRIKDIIIRAGRNIYPQELEEVVNGVEGIRKGCVAVFATRDDRAETERLVVMAETRVAGAAEREALKKRISDAALAALELSPDEIALVAPRTVPKTSSGKIRRSAARDIYENRVKAGGEPSAMWVQVARLALSGAATRVQRGFAAAGDLAYGAWWWLVLAVAALTTWLGVLLLPGREARHGLVHRAARAFLRLTGTRVDVDGEAPPQGRAAIIAANHTSYLDGLLLCAAMPGRLAFVAKHELSQQWVAGPMLKRLGTLFARRTDAKGGLEDAAAQLAALKAGERIVSFPEGTLTRMPGLLPFRLGAFQMAAEAGVPVIPVTIRGARSALRSDQWFPRRVPIRLIVGQPITPDGADFAAAVRLRDAVRAEILAKVGEPDLARERIELPPLAG